MANQQVHIYDSYKREAEKNNVEPIVSPKGEMQVDLNGEVWTESRTMTARWGDQ